MPPEQSSPHGDAHGYTVHLTEQREGWSVTVTRAGRAAAFEAHHRDPQAALAMAKTLATTEGADLVILMAEGRDVRMTFVPADRVASYVLPVCPPRDSR